MVVLISQKLLFQVFDMRLPIFTLLLFGSTCALAQVGIGTSAPHASAVLEVQSTQKGLLIPRMSSTDRDAITSPATGLLIFNSTTNSFQYYTGGAWAEIGLSSVSNANVDANAAIAFTKLNISASDIRGLTPYSASTGLTLNSGAFAIDNSVVTSNYSGSAVIGQSLSAGGSGDASAILAATSTTKGFLPPRMTAAQKAAINPPAQGLIIYQTDGTQGLYVYDGASWMHHSQWYSNTATTPSVFSLSKPASLSASGASANIGIGSGSLAALTDGDNSVALGVNALNDITTDGNATAVGYGALSATTGTGNTALGYTAGSSNVTGFNNTFLGTSTSSSSSNLSNASAIGYGAEVTASNSIQLGNSSVTNVNTAGGITTGGSVGVGTTTPNASAILDITSTSKGVLVPRMTTSQRDAISSAVEGLLIYNTTANQFEAYKKSKLPEKSMIDQMPASPNTSTGGNGAWQSFTATENGYLTKITLYQNNGLQFPTTTFDWSMTVYSGVTSNNGSSLSGGKTIGYTKITLPDNGNADFRHYQFDPPIHVESGQQYWFKINELTSGGYYTDTYLHSTDIYPSNDSWIGGFNRDLVFEVFIKPEGSLIWCEL
jgi:hypothetical protein